MSQSVVFLTGSPATGSRSAFVAHAVASEALRAGLRPVFWSLADFDPADVLFGRAGAPGVARFIDGVKEAAALVLATPVYKATYAGALKAIVDLIPPDALVDKPTLGIATARLAAHATGVDQSYRSLFAFFRARALDTLFLTDDELQLAPGACVLSVDAEQRVRRAGRTLVQATEETARAVSVP
jgi:FMN reductase